MPRLDLNLHLILPEMVVTAAALGVILADVMLPAARRAVPAALTAAAGLLLALGLLVLAPATGTAMLFTGEDGGRRGGWDADGFSVFVRALAAAGGFLTVLLAVPYMRRLDRGHGEFFALLLFAILGVMLVSGVSDLLTLFICLELVTVSSYVLAAFKRNDLASTEAGIKYLVIGALSSAVLLMGIALAYGGAGDVTFASLSEAVQAGRATPLVVPGLLLVLVGVLFKVGAVPFHVWIPDVYQGAPSPVTAFLSTGSKAAGMILLLRAATAILEPDPLWFWVLGIVAVATLLFGVLGAVPQRDFKRLLGYSSIGHAGYLLLGVVAMLDPAPGRTGGPGALPGATAILFYLLAFVFTNLTAFTVVVLVSASTGSRHGHASYAGLWKRHPFLAVCLALALLSLAGVPPLSGFFGKFLVLQALVDKGLLFLAFLGAGGVAVSLYFYLLWLREVYARDPDPALGHRPLLVGPFARVVLVVGIVAMLGMGIFMGPFHRWAEGAASSLVSGDGVAAAAAPATPDR